MDGDYPPKPMRIPFRKIRDHLAAIYKWQRRNRPIYGGLLEQRPNGFAVRRPETGGGGYIPPFSPTLTTGAEPLVHISPGYIHAPYASKASGEIHEHLYYPWMPKISSRELDHPEAYPVPLTKGATNYIMLQVALNQRETVLGASESKNIDQATPGNESPTGVQALTVNMPSTVLEDSNSDTASWTSEPYLRLDNLSYDVDIAPVFIWNTTGWSIDEVDEYFIPWGKYELDAEGAEVSSEWYWTGHRQITTPQLVRGGQASGHTQATGIAAADGDDTGANPKVNFN